MPAGRHRFCPDAEDYEYLKGVGPAELAWEWLRRYPGYRMLSRSARHRTPSGTMLIEPVPIHVRLRWGCLTVENVHERSVDVPVLWDSAVDSSVLRVEARPAKQSNEYVFDLDRWGSKAVLVIAGPRDEHLLLRDGHHRLRLHVIAGTLLEGPVNLRFMFDGDGHFMPALTTLRQLLHLSRSGRWLSRQIVMHRTLRRGALALRVHDARSSGASIREIGIILFGEARINAEWQAPGEALRSQCRRLIALADAMAKGGYRTLLR